MQYFIFSQNFHRYIQCSLLCYYCPVKFAFCVVCVVSRFGLQWPWKSLESWSSSLYHSYWCYFLWSHCMVIHVHLAWTLQTCTYYWPQWLGTSKFSASEAPKMFDVVGKLLSESICCSPIHYDRWWKDIFVFQTLRNVLVGCSRNSNFPGCLHISSFRNLYMYPAALAAQECVYICNKPQKCRGYIPLTLNEAVVSGVERCQKSVDLILCWVGQVPR